MAELTPEEYQQALQDRELANLQGLGLRNEAGAPYYHAQTMAQVMDDRLGRMQANAQQDDASQFQSRYQDAIQSGQDPFAVNAASRPSSLSGWATTPESGGLGLAGRASQAPGPPALNPQQQQGQDFNDFYKQLPWAVRASLVEHGGVAALATQFSGRREALAAQLAQQEEKKRQDQWGNLFKIIGDDKATPPQQMEMLGQLSKTFPEAAVAKNVINERMLSDFRANKDLLPRSPEEYMTGLKDGSITWHDVAADIGLAKEERISTARETAEERKMQRLFNKFTQDPRSLNQTEHGLLVKYMDAQKKRDLEIQDLQQTLKDKQAMSPLNVQAKQLEITRGQAPIVSAPYMLPGGEHANIITNPMTGKRQVSSGVPQTTQNQRMLSPAMTKDRAEIYTGMSTLKDVAAKFSKDFVGPVDSGLNYVMRIFGHDPSRNITPGKGEAPVKVTSSEFRTSYDKLIKVLRKEAMGTAQTASETSNAPLAFPSPTDADADITIPSFLKSGYQEYVRKMEGQDRVMDEQRRMNPVPASLRMKQLMDIAQAKDAKGKNALGYQNPKDMEEAIAERLAEEAQRGWIVINQPVPQRR